MNGMLDQASLWAINVVIHATILTAVSLLLAMMFRKIAVMRYWILCCGMLLVLVSPVIAALIQSRGNSWLALSTKAAEASGEPIATSDHISEFPSNSDRIRSVPMTEGSTSRAERSGMTSAPAAEHLPESPATSPTANESPIVPSKPAAGWRLPTQWLPSVVLSLMLVWAIGSVICLVRMSVGWLRLSRVLKRARPIENVALHREFDRACQAVGCGRDRAPRLLASTDVSGPIAAGLFDSAVVIPAHLLEQVQPAELADVLVHEVAHVVRRDQIVVLLQNLVAAIYWPHPLIKRLNGELAKAREEVCDNFVLGRTAAANYSRTLLSLAEMVQRSETMPGSVGFFTSRWKLEQRVAGILDEHRDRTTFLSKRGWVFVAASSLALVTLMCLGTITIATAQNREKDVADVVETKREGEESITVSGIVRGPDGSPVADARVIAVEQFVANIAWTRTNEILAETTSDSDGRYSLALNPPSNRFSNGKHFEIQHTGILATHASFGPDEEIVSASAADVDLQLAAAKLPILGTVLDLEGRPIPGVRVRLVEIHRPNTDFGRADAVAKWAEAAQANPTAFESDPMADPFADPNVAEQIRFYPSGKRLMGSGVLGIETTTDSGGRFRLDGVGDDCMATLRIDGPGIASSLVPVVAREMNPVNTPELGPQYRTGKTFGNEFTLAAEPTQVVRGIVRDRDSGDPIAGTTVSVWQLPESFMRIDGFLSVTTDANGRYELSGLPRKPAQAKRPIRLAVEPPTDQPYFRSKHDVPTREGFDPIEFDIKLTRGVWATGQVTEAASGDPVPSMVSFHPYLDNPHAKDHEAFNAGITSMGYDEMFPTDLGGNFRVPALRGTGVLRVVADNTDDYEVVAVPGTEMLQNGLAKPLDTRQIYHVIMPGNAVVDTSIKEDATQAEVSIKLNRLKSIQLRVLNPDGSEATGFDVAGRQNSQRATLTGRGVSYWQNEPSKSSTIDVISGDAKDDDRPVMLLDHDRDLGAVRWLSKLKQSKQSPLDVQLQQSAKITGTILQDENAASGPIWIATGLGGFDDDHSMNGADSVNMRKRLRFPVQGGGLVKSDGSFEITVPPGGDYSAKLHSPKRDHELFENESLGPGETLDLGTIDTQADPNTWPKPKHQAESLIKPITIAEPTGIVPVEFGESATDMVVKPMFGGRRGAMKAALLATDGSPETAKAVELGLKWLARQQRKDGSWSMRGPYEDGAYQENTTAATAMALLAFQGDGNTHRDGPYAKTVAQGLKYLLNRQSKENGFFASNEPDRQQAYAHAQATIAVCELYGMTQDALLRQPTEAAVEFSVRAQSESGGWRYLPRSGSDLSVTGWYVMALVSAKSAGIRVKNSVLAEVQSYLDRVSVEDGAGYCYQEGRPAGQTMTAEGLLCRQYLGWAHDREPMAIGLNTLVQDLPINRDSMNVYYWYYATQALHHFGGSGWTIWNNNMKQVLPAMQVKRGNEAGSWSPQTDEYGNASGRLYTTCFCIYCLEVYYRHLPLYKMGAE